MHDREMETGRRLRERAGALAANLLLAAAVSVLTLAALEGVLRLVLPMDSRHYVARPHTRLVLEPDPEVIPGVEGPSVYEVNELGIRGRPFGSGAEYRILAIGGSTTELLYVDGPRSWPAVLESSLGSTADGEAVWVGNVGRAGQNSRDHVLHVKYLTEQYPGLDAIVLMVGVNDLSLALGEASEGYVLPPSVADPAAEAEQVRRAFQVAPPPRLAGGADLPFRERLALWDLVQRVRATGAAQLNALLAERAQGELIRRWRENRLRHAGLIDTLPDLTLPLEEYRRNLDLIVDHARARDLRLVFATQPYLWRPDLDEAESRLLWMGGADKMFQARSGSAYFTPAALAEAMDLYNRALLDVCREREVECVDLATVLPRDTTMFFDDVHFTDAGSLTVARTFVEHFAARPPFAGATHAGR